MKRRHEMPVFVRGYIRRPPRVCFDRVTVAAQGHGGGFACTDFNVGIGKRLVREPIGSHGNQPDDSVFARRRLSKNKQPLRVCFCTESEEIKTNRIKILLWELEH